ncbi:hypothetical protein HGM15179_009578 [Zosterops borbonicus]|uniref:Uncharacterized protein n=1 Tax=Zosterops borbonicus TaxID=364589 RepID=A0A8K1GGW9_9PASS|nr:hypothetical protein HGM15179_009578 [Zosterops borbonicus]
MGDKDNSKAWRTYGQLTTLGSKINTGMSSRPRDAYEDDQNIPVKTVAVGGLLSLAGAGTVWQCWGIARDFKFEQGLFEAGTCLNIYMWRGEYYLLFIYKSVDKDMAENDKTLVSSPRRKD